MNILNQKPIELSPVYNASIRGQFDPTLYLQETMVTPLFNPLIANQPVEIKYNNKKCTDQDIKLFILGCMDDHINTAFENIVKDLFRQTLIYFDNNTNLTVQNTFAIQAAKKEKLPYPTPNIIYTPTTDVIPACKEFLAGLCNYEKMFASLAFYARPEVFGVYFATSHEFEVFKKWLNTEIQTIISVLPSNTLALLQQFQNLKLEDLTESLRIRGDNLDGNQEYSFARILTSYLMLYTKIANPSLYGLLPFNVGELFCPKSIVFVNIERHAKASARKVADEWFIINKANSMQPKIANGAKLQKLTSLARSIHKIKHKAGSLGIRTKSGDLEKSASVRFRKTRPTNANIYNAIIKVIKRMTRVAMSENSYKTVKMTFARPNRRNPDDFNKQGKMISTKYKPDIHLYIDTSASITESNYQDAIKLCIDMAKKLNINIYFNSFSHILSQCSHLKLKSKTKTQIYKEFQKIPKVGGGTNYEQIWHYINKSPKRRRELSIIITDFEYNVPNHYVKHPKNLYYVPCSNIKWNNIIEDAKQFCEAMTHIDPKCRNKLLF